uniref:Uncharacterized protein n=1 Tax=Anguilla anguilla TaxID=7936 RepID=A0A0E9S9W2_ANGAN
MQSVNGRMNEDASLAKLTFSPSITMVIATSNLELMVCSTCVHHLNTRIF